jgi:hypothetical protein
MMKSIANYGTKTKKIKVIVKRAELDTKSKHLL